MAKIGDVIDGKYEILKEIGRGGMSIVWLAMDKSLNRQWAVKEIKKKGTDKENKVVFQSLMSEANLMIKLDHPALPRIVGIIETGETIYVVMDYIEGEPLNKVLEKNGAQPQKAVIDWGIQLAGVLDYLHTREPAIIYRDMKPANIMLKPDGTVKLFDFGIAREYKVGKEGDTIILGTPEYAAFEQYGGMGQTDARTDIFGLGATLHHLVTGEKPRSMPYERGSIREINPELSDGLDFIIQKCTKMRPEDRFQSCMEVSVALRNYTEFGKGPIHKRNLKIFIASAAMTLAMAIVGTGTLIGYKATLSQTVKETINLYGMNSADGGNLEELSKSIKTYSAEVSAETAEELITNYKGVFTDQIEQYAKDCSNAMDNEEMKEEKEELKKEFDESEKEMFNNMNDIVSSLDKELKDLKSEIKDDIYYFAGDIYLNYYKCSEGKLNDNYIIIRNEEAALRFSKISDDYDEEVLSYTERICNVCNAAKMLQDGSGISDNEHVISEKDRTDAWKIMKEAIDGKDGEGGEQRYSNRVNLYLIIGNITYEHREEFRKLSDVEEDNVRTKNEIISFSEEAVAFLKDDTKVENVKSSSVESINSKRQKAITYFKGIYETLAEKELEG